MSIDPDLARAFKLVLGGETPSHQAVLGDLTMFCHLEASTAQPSPSGMIDPYHMAKMEGRREVMLRIQALLDTPLNVFSAAAMAQRRNEQQNRR